MTTPTSAVDNLARVQAALDNLGEAIKELTIFREHYDRSPLKTLAHDRLHEKAAMSVTTLKGIHTAIRNALVAAEKGAIR